MRDVKSTGQNPGFQCPICPTGEDPVALGDVDGMTPAPQVPEYGLFSGSFLNE